MRIDMQPSISPEAYLEELAKEAKKRPPRPVEVLPVEDCLGRILAHDVHASVTIPGFNNSAMDGYAVRYRDLPGQLRIVGEQPAGLDRGLVVEPDQAVRIMTGAPVPQGADTVVQSELTTEADNVVDVHENVPLGANIRLPGEDVKEGERVLIAGMTLKPRDLSAAVAVGAASLSVYAPLKVGVVSTGDELASPGEPLKPGQIYESNSVLLSALAKDLGASVVTRTVSRDATTDLENVLNEICTQVDVILMSGGVSVGRFDVVRNLLGKQHEAHFTRVAIQPGKPQGHARWNGTPILAFPGNPVGAFVSFQLFGIPFLRTLSGAIAQKTPTFTAVAGSRWRSPKGRRQFVPIRLEERNDDLPLVYPTAAKGSGSHLVASLVRAEMLAVVPEEITAVEVGDKLTVMEIQ